MRSTKKRGFYGILLFLIIISNLGFIYAFSGDGLGTEEDPFLITTWAQLSEMNDDLTSCYSLENNLTTDMGDYDTYASATANLGEGWTPIGGELEGYSGLFDGQNYVIDGITIRANGSYIGLFGNIDGGGVYNIGVTNCDIEDYSPSGTYIGCLVGSMTGGGEITDSYTTGNISSVAELIYGLGGFIGDLEDGTINTCYSNVHMNITQGVTVGGFAGYMAGGNIVDSYSLGNVEGSDEIGGFIGTLNAGEIHQGYSTGSVTSTGLITGSITGGFAGSIADGLISDSYSTSSVTGFNNTGGFLGIFSGGLGSILFSYSSGAVSGTTNVGGFMGGDTSLGNLNSFWNTETSGQATSVGDETGLTSSEMQNISIFTAASWDIDNASVNFDGNDFPFLYYQTGESAHYWYLNIPVLYAAPTITIVSPVTGTQYDDDVNLLIQVTVVDESNDSTCYYNLTSSSYSAHNVAISDCNSTSVFLSTDGTFTLTVWVYNAVNDTDSDSVSFSIEKSSGARGGGAEIVSSTVYYDNTTNESILVNNTVEETSSSNFVTGMFSAGNININFQKILIGLGVVLFFILVYMLMLFVKVKGMRFN